MALRRRGEPVTAMLTGLTRLVIVSAIAVFLVSTAGHLADVFSSDMMNSTVAYVGNTGWGGIVSTTLIASAIAPGDAMALIISLLIIFASLMRLMLMIMRIGLLVILTGTLLLAAAASMSDWERHGGASTSAGSPPGRYISRPLYKPAAALLYVAAFQLTQGHSLVETLSGFMLLILAVAAAGALATGAIRAGLHRPGGLAAAVNRKGSSAPATTGDRPGRRSAREVTRHPAPLLHLNDEARLPRRPPDRPKQAPAPPRNPAGAAGPGRRQPQRRPPRHTVNRSVGQRRVLAIKGSTGNESAIGRKRGPQGRPDATRPGDKRWHRSVGSQRPR